MTPNKREFDVKYTCWFCLLGSFFKALKGTDEVSCICDQKDSRLVKEWKDMDGEFHYEMWNR